LPAPIAEVRNGDADKLLELGGKTGMNTRMCAETNSDEIAEFGA